MRLAIALLVMQAQVALARPCICKDIPTLKNRLAEVTNYLEAWRSVLNDCYSNDPPRDFEQTKQRFDKYAFGGERPSNIQTAGTVSLGGTNVTKAFENQYCDEIVKDVNDVHEADHNRYMWIHALPLLVGIAFGNPYTAMIRNTALSEVQGHEAEKAYLEQELQRLERACQPHWKCRCNQQVYESAGACAASCPPASLRCIAPTCLEIDSKTGRWNGKAL